MTDGIQKISGTSPWALSEGQITQRGKLGFFLRDQIRNEEISEEP